MHANPFRIKSVVVCFSALWYTIVFLSNTLDLFKELSVLPESFAFHSGNFGLIEKVTAVHGFPHSLNIGLLIGVILFEGLVGFLFWRLFFQLKTDLDKGGPQIQLTYFLGITLWGLFLVFDEIFLVYRVFNGEVLHFTILIFHLISYQFMLKEGAKE